MAPDVVWDLRRSPNLRFRIPLVLVYFGDFDSRVAHWGTGLGSVRPASGGPAVRGAFAGGHVAAGPPAAIARPDHRGPGPSRAVFRCGHRVGHRVGPGTVSGRRDQS